MAITLVQEKGATGLSATFTSAPTAGDLLIATIVWRNGTAVAAPTGFTMRTFKGGLTGDGVAICEKISNGTESGAIAFTGSSTSTNIVVWEFAGNAASGSEYDTASAGTTGTAITAQPGSLSPANAGELFILLEGYSSGAHGPWSVDSSFNLVETGVITGAVHGYKIQSGGAAAENPTITATSSGPFECTMAAFVAAAGGGSPAIIPDRNYPLGVNRGVLRGVA